MNTFLIYLWSISENVQCLFFLLGGFATIVAILLGGIAFCDGDDDGTASMKVIGVVGVGALLLGAAIPDRAGIAAMVIVPRIAESETLKRDMPEIYQFAVERLKESLMKKPEKE